MSNYVLLEYNKVLSDSACQVIRASKQRGMSFYPTAEAAEHMGGDACIAPVPTEYLREIMHLMFHKNTDGYGKSYMETPGVSWSRAR